MTKKKLDMTSAYITPKHALSSESLRIQWFNVVNSVLLLPQTNRGLFQKTLTLPSTDPWPDNGIYGMNGRKLVSSYF
jgi:hypothetical protein